MQDLMRYFDPKLALDRYVQAQDESHKKLAQG